MNRAAFWSTPTRKSPWQLQPEAVANGSGVREVVLGTAQHRIAS
jgi:hypothetical protein